MECIVRAVVGRELCADRSLRSKSKKMSEELDSETGTELSRSLSSSSNKRRRLDTPSSPLASALSLSSSLSLSPSLSLFHSLRSLRQFDVLTDVTLRAGLCEVKAHRCVLAASSDYFKACLTSQMREGNERNPILDLPLLESEALYRVTDFIYGEEIEIHSENIISLLDSADKLCLDRLKFKCCTYLNDSLTPQSCLTVYSLADRYNCVGLCQTIFEYICHNFETVSRGEEFLKLSFEEVIRYLSSDSLSVKNESVTFQTAMNWILYSLESRAEYLQRIFETVRLKFMTVQDIAQFIHPYFTSPPLSLSLFSSSQGHHCLLQIMDAYRWHALPVTHPERSPSLSLSQSQPSNSTPLTPTSLPPLSLTQNQHHPLDTPRHYSRKHALRDRLVVLGGDDGYDDHSPFNSIVIYDETLKEWISLPSFSQARSVPGAVSFDDCLCVVGGYDGARASSSVDIFHIHSNTWTSGPPLKQRRCSCVCVVCEGYVYCIGGVCGPQALNSLEKISVDELKGISNSSQSLNGWTECSSLNENRSACGAAVLCERTQDTGVGEGEGVGENTQTVRENEKMRLMILVCGGITTGGDTVNTTEMYSSQTQTWAAMAPMISPRRSFGMCVARGKAYAFGGNDGTRDLSSVEEYDPQTNTWRQLSPMLFCRMFCSAAVLGDKIVVVGGVNGGVTLDCCESYDPDTDEWTVLEPTLPSPMCGCGVVSAEDVPYSFILNLVSSSEDSHSNEEKVA